MSTFEAEAFKVGDKDAWRIRCSSPGHPPHFVVDGFVTRAEAQTRADSLTAMEAFEDAA